MNKNEKHAKTITLITALLLSAILVAGAYAMTVTPGSGSVPVGSTTTIPIILDQSPDNLGYVNITCKHIRSVCSTDYRNIISRVYKLDPLSTG